MLAGLKRESPTIGGARRGCTPSPFTPAACCNLSPARAQLLRQGQLVEEDLVVQPNDMLVPVHTYDRLPMYFIYAGALAALRFSHCSAS